ncbi:hypothetical protein E2562_028428 [Oryza meyeriana var. granulata]|uniref:Uncharacterized protein n=1 Tax=Oryza meyeriana var. granulata TaxID=110450 RepID=A0A6G1EQU3_9ORYZ|nr:hypothetical protein E2562_028428 [Oryza meyeriana var. granulata]
MEISSLGSRLGTPRSMENIALLKVLKLSNKTLLSSFLFCFSILYVAPHFLLYLDVLGVRDLGLKLIDLVDFVTIGPLPEPVLRGGAIWTVDQERGKGFEQGALRRRHGQGGSSGMIECFNRAKARSEQKRIGKWAAFIERNKIPSDHTWFNMMFELKHLWASAYQVDYERNVSISIHKEE